MDNYTTVTTGSTTYGILTVQDEDSGRWTANVAELGADGDVIRTLVDEDGFVATYGEQGSERDAIFIAMQVIF
jgi:hypothetical protein